MKSHFALTDFSLIDRGIRLREAEWISLYITVFFVDTFWHAC